MEDIRIKIVRYKELEREASNISFMLLVNENIIFGPRKLKKANDQLVKDMEKVSQEMNKLYPDIKDYYEVDYMK